MPTMTHSEGPKTGALPVVILVLVVMLVCSALLAAWTMVRGDIRVSTDGIARAVPAGATIADLERSGYLAKNGALRSVNGSVIATYGGNPPSVSRNGVPVLRSETVFEGDSVASARGTDREERAVTVLRPLPAKTVLQGDGPVINVAQMGNPGVAKVTKGAISGEVWRVEVVRPAEEMVLVRHWPASGDKVVALTFDDGPWPAQTEKILAILSAAGIHGTFFELGGQAKQWPTISKAVVAQGSLLGNHTYSHALLTKLKAPQVKKEISGGASTIGKVAGVKPVWFRPPYGAINSTVWQQSRALGQKVVLWDVDTLDWTKPGPAKIVQNAVTHVRPGSVVLMHDGGGDRSQTIAALPQVIAALKAQGYSFVTVDQLAALP
jgi:peptidoglycan-N-acetylglucosamine deacetylase